MVLKKKVEELEQQLAQRQQELEHKVRWKCTDMIKKTNKIKNSGVKLERSCSGHSYAVTPLLFLPDG